KVRLRFDNPEERLKPNMYANVKIYGGAKENTIVIPLEGLIRTGRDERVIISLGDGKFEARDVVAGIESGDYVEILSGVEEGDQIVISAQFLIDSEASMRASLTRMSPVEDASDMDKPADGSSTTSATGKSVSGNGVIKQIDRENRKLTLQHDAIEALGWPAMTMDFTLMDDVAMDALTIDEKVMFQLDEQDDRYLISAIHNADAMKMTEQE
ncbi:MAG TPA: efflux transporter periplasmic adaptor subunit, partial [Gammaproteobacteria bacterium]|nr:efflux transporter periplasmic adaptor subunit [Gammaproteobacteria bacterium]